MNALVVDNVTLRACAELLMELVESTISLSIYDMKGQVVWRYSARAEDDIEQPLWLHPDKPIWFKTDEDVMVRAYDISTRVLAHGIPGSDGNNELFLYLLHTTDTDADKAVGLTPEHRAIVSMGKLLSGHFALSNELNSMTDELARRYEELNLVYNTDEEIRSLSERESVLNQLVESCIDHLNVDVAVLYLTDGTPAIVAQGYDAECDRLAEQVDGLRDPLFKLSSLRNESVVLNTPEEHASCGVDLACDDKIVVSPILDEQGRLFGAMVLISARGNRDFENGDRNLLSVMAAKVSKIVSADYDSLTGLVTREGFEQGVRDVLAGAASGERNICLLHANVDQLQLVNDTFGHSAGDEILQKIASLLPKQLRNHDRISRLGGDEFGILLLDCTLENAKRMADRVCENVAQLTCRHGDRSLDVGISVGVAKLDADSESVVGAMATADLACSVAKEQGRNRAFAYRVEDQEMQARKHQMHWVGKIQSALKLDQFELYSQAIEPTDLVHGRSHFEILLRMVDEHGVIQSPNIFMPVAERYHLMPSIDRWVIQHSLETLSQWCSAGGISDAVFGINLSGESLTDERTLEFLVSQLRKTSVSTENLCFEITESAAITNLADAESFIASVKNFGCRFALDDFGAGVSSFANLRALDVDYLKIDGSFVVDMATDPVSAAMVSAINQVGQTMNLHTVAEFVESPAIRKLLVELGVDYLQGYDIGKPRPLVEQLQELSSRNARSA